MENIIYLIIGLFIGVIAVWIILTLKNKSDKIPKAEFESMLSNLNNCITELGIEKEKNKIFTENLDTFKKEYNEKETKNYELNSKVAVQHTQIENLREQISCLENEKKLKEDTISEQQIIIQNNERNLASLQAQLETKNTIVVKYEEEAIKLKNELQNINNNYNELNKKTATLSANNEALNEKLVNQLTEIEDLRNKFNLEFENIASKILDQKSEKFTNLNKQNIEAILTPLGENLIQFRSKVEEVYNKESNERFSLGKEVEKLFNLNQKLSEDANNLTLALKGGSPKLIGDWGQMILEKILEMSGLTKDREYQVQPYLRDEDGNTLKNEEGKKLQPDIIVFYPDDRRVIIDSKVSLAAYTRYVKCENTDEQQIAINDHINSMKTHIDALCSKNYQDFAPSLDFVMMFVPNEPAYFLAMKNDETLWQYAYNKRILLTSPTNLIAALKLVADLWKREYQSRHAQEIAFRGAALYDKLVIIVNNMKELGNIIDKAQSNYKIVYGQLAEGKGNLASQVEKMKELGLKTKKSLPISSIQIQANEEVKQIPEELTDSLDIQHN
ncbi:MAG: DNA recombination protein RmuC [Ignavibacteriae bacterium]|nr:MAG: DNA recombination protein RmuC [Ignavibacteriota bacterium]